MGISKASMRLIITVALVVGASTPALAVPPPDEIPPSTPPNFAATAASGTQINLSWGAATDNKAVTGYHISLCTPQGACTIFNTVASTARSFSHMNLTPGATYRYMLAAFDAAGNQSETPAYANATTLDTIPPTVPGNLGAVAASAPNRSELGRVHRRCRRQWVFNRKMFRRRMR